MAIETWYIDEINVGGTNPNRLWYNKDPAANVTQTTAITGFIVGKTGALNYRILAQGQELAGFTTTLAPNNTAPAVDNSYPTVTGFTPPDLLSDVESILTLYEYNGYFAAGTWTFNFPVVAVTAGGAQDGRIRLRVFKATRSGTAFGTVTELTTAGNPPLTGTTVTNLAVGTPQTSAVTWSNPAFFLNNEFLVIKIAWEITGAGGAANADVLFRYGNGATMISSTFRDRSYNIT